MSGLLPFIVSGIATGAVYGLAGSGLALTYKTSGIFNFGHGAVATVAAYVFYSTHVEHGWDWKASFVVSVLLVGPLVGLLLERVARRLATQQTAYKIVATVGIVVGVQGIAAIMYGLDPLPFPQYLPKGTETFEIVGVRIGYDQVIVTAVALVAVVALYALFQRTRLGLAMRAVVDDADLLDVQGTDPIRVRRLAWIAGSTFAALSGVLVAPMLGLESITLTFLVVQAFGAAAIGAFSSIPLTFLGGALIGIAADLSKKYVLEVSWLSGLPQSLPFIVLFIVLLAMPKRKLVPPASVEQRPPMPYKGPPLLRGSVGLAVLVPLLLVPVFVDAELSFFSNALVDMILLLSLGLLVRTSGQVSLCHAAFMAVGACAFSQLTVEHGVPWFAALLLGALVAVPLGALVALPAIRLSGLFLALATFGFGILVERLIFPLGLMFGTTTEGREMPTPSFVTSDRWMYYVILGFFVVTALVMVAIHEGRLGRVLRGLSDSPTAVSTLGLSTNVTRVIVFCLSAFFAAVAGILHGVVMVYATSADPKFGSFNSLLLLVMLALAPFREPWYVLPAAVGAIVPAYVHGDHTTLWLNVLFGVFAIVVSLQGGPPVMGPRLRSLLDRAFGRRRPAPAPAMGAVPPARSAPGDGGLEVQGLSVRFGGIVAVDDLTMSARLGQITGLIGPNGAGKTTTFNACSGLNRPAAGRILLHGEDVSGLAPSARARRGLGRTFQRMELCDTLSVADNVALGREAGQAGARVLRQLVAPRAEHRETVAAAAAAMELCGISDLADRQAGELSTGQRRLVELARCLAGPFDVLLLDEPSSGLDRAETDTFAGILETVVAERGCGILLVEHDVGLVMRVCHQIYVLDFGQLIFSGDPAAVAASSKVRAAYLGDAGEITVEEVPT